MTLSFPSLFGERQRGGRSRWGEGLRMLLYLLSHLYLTIALRTCLT
jgi:hypothetical protein